MTDGVTSIILAGKRAGALDPLAAKAGVSQKCVVPVGGMPMIEHTVRALAACEPVTDIRVVAHDTAEIVAIPIIASLIAEGRLSFRPAAFNLVDSVTAAADGAQFPLLITTADNCLVTPEGYTEFIEKARADGLEAASAMSRREDVQAADRDGQARFYKFRDGEFSNCNMYWLATPRSLQSAEIFRNGGQFVKFPARIAKAFGLTNLIRFHFGWANRDKLFAAISRRFGFEMRPITMSKGEYAIDVDNERTFHVTEKLLAQRAQQTQRVGSTGGALASSES